MKPKTYLSIITDERGFIPTPHLRRVLVKNTRKTAREEAIAAKIIEAASPRENISGSHPWGPEEQIAIQQLWIHDDGHTEWRPIPFDDSDLYTVQNTEYGDLPVPNAVRQPAAVPMDLAQKVREALGEE